METKIGGLTIDASLIDSIQKGDETIILQLYDVSFSIMMNMVVRYKNNHEDRVSLINNAFMKVIKNMRDFKLGTSYVAWMNTILKREIIDDFRRNKRRYMEISMSELPQEQVWEAFDVSIDRQIETAHVQRLLLLLPPATRTVFNLFVWEDLSPTEIANALQISVETVRWHIKMARKLMRQQIELT